MESDKFSRNDWFFYQVFLDPSIQSERCTWFLYLYVDIKHLELAKSLDRGFAPRNCMLTVVFSMNLKVGKQTNLGYDLLSTWNRDANASC